MSDLTFAKASLPFLQQGAFPAKDLLPIIPPGAKIGSSSVIKADQLGKIPGRYHPTTGEWVGLTGAWPTMGVDAAFSARASAWPTGNVGLRAASWPAVDVDVSTEEARDMVENVIAQKLGLAPVRVRDGAPRSLFVFSSMNDEDPIRKMRLTFVDTNGNEHAVEILAYGQQYLIAGTHPSGAQYHWREGAELSVWGAGGLTKISPQDARNFMDALSGEIDARGWKIIRDVRLNPSSSGAGFAVKDIEPVVPSEVALGALNAIPNTEDVLPSREDFISVIAAFKAALGATAEEYVEAVRDWAMRHDWADSDYFEGVWRSLTHVRTSADYLFGLARKFGFSGDAQNDFKDFDNELDAELDEVTQKIVHAQSMTDETEEALRAVARNVVYWEEAAKWIDCTTKAQLSVTAFNQSPNLGCKIAPSGKTGVETASNRLLNSKKAQVVHGMTYLPGQKQLVTWENGHGLSLFYFNKWTDVPVPVFDADDDAISPWLEHVSYLFDDPEDRDYLLDFFAHVVQKRGRKIRWAPIIIGNQGVGKDLLLRPIVKGLGEKTNAQTVQPERIMGNFVDFWEKELVIVEEINRTSKTDVYERMKPVIAGTVSDMVTIERKHEQSYDVPNVVNILFFSNHADAINLSADDRRFFVIHSYAEPRGSDYYEYLAKDFYEKQNGWQKVWWWLKRRDISHFNPDARPRFNEAKAQMIEDTAPHYFLWMRDKYLVNRSVVLVKDILSDISSDYSSGVPGQIRDTMRGQSQVVKALTFSGWKNKQIRWGDHDKTRVTVWCRTKEIADSPPDTIRARYDSETKKKLANVG